MSVNWGYFDKFEWANEKYLPRWGEGETKATQIVTAISQLVYRWYNDGDVFDNSYLLDGWCDYLPSCANWLEQHTTDEVSPILHRISECYTDEDYEELLKNLADTLLDEDYLEEQNKLKKKAIYVIAKVVLNTLTLMRVKIGKVDKKELKGGNIMHIHTMDENYDYRMRRLVEKFVQDYEIEEREPTALEDIIWKEYAESFGRMVLEDMIEYAGDELFEI